MSWTGRLRRAAGSGTWLDLSPDTAGDGHGSADPGQGIEAVRIPAEDIRAVLVEQDLLVDARGLQIRGALVTGTLDLNYAMVSCPLAFEHCRFENVPSFEQSILVALRFDDVTVPGLSLHAARLTGDCSFTDSSSYGGVDARNIAIEGMLDLAGANLNNPDGAALNLDGADIKAGVFLNSLVAEGEVTSSGAVIGKKLMLTGAKLITPGGKALNLDETTIAGGTFMACLVAQGEIRAVNARFNGPLVLQGAEISNPSGRALHLDGAYIGGGAFLNEFKAEGEVRAIDASIRGTLDLTKTQLINPTEKALYIDRAEIGGSIILEDALTEGEICALGVRVRSQLVLTRAKLTNINGKVLSLDRTNIVGCAFLDKLVASGEIRAPGAHIGSPLVLKGAKINNPGRTALDLSGATLDELTLDDALTVAGRTNLSFVSIRILTAGSKPPRQGLLPLSSAHGWKLGTVNGFLRTDRRSAKAWLDTIDTQPVTGRQKNFSSQPWKELARIYDEIGQPEDGRRLRFWAACKTTRVAPWPSKLYRWPYAVLVGYGYYPLIVLLWLTALWLTVLILCSVNAPAFSPSDPRFGTFTITTHGRPEVVRVTGATPQADNYPSFNPGLFAVDTAIPAADTGQSTAWRVTANTWLPSVFAAIKGIAWLLTALLLTGITGLLRKD